MVNNISVFIYSHELSFLLRLLIICRLYAFVCDTRHPANLRTDEVNDV